MDPRDQLRPLLDGVGCTVCGSPVPGERIRILGDRADEVLFGPRATLGPPWAKDHRMALAATIVAR